MRYFVAILVLLLLPSMGPQAQTKSSGSPPAASTKPAPTATTDATKKRIEKYLRDYYAWGPEVTVTVGTPKPAQVPSLSEVPVTVTVGGQSDAASVYVSNDGRFIFRGDLSDMTADPYAETREKLHAGTSPSKGPADAKVTLIEFADFECPSCRNLDLVLRDMLPKYPSVRLVYKNFPLNTIHPWAMTAAIAGQCASKQSLDLFWKFHDAIFDAQDEITIENAPAKLGDIATTQGLDIASYRACIANQQTIREVETDISEGKALKINATPTIFINARRLTGGSESTLGQLINYEQNEPIH